ncbi:MAG: hypothetical protein LBI29_02385 [Rickettsiales bacterium]|jgi:hypothetical protein|nr:hypothetical protein [Rickettsiales bacterium]
MAFKKLENGRKFNNYDLLKSLAFFTMIIDHVGLFFFNKIKFLRVIGRTSAIIYAILFGINKKKNNDKIIIGAIAMSMAWTLLQNRIFPLNVLYNFYLSGFLVDSLNNLYSKNFLLFLLVLILLVAIGEKSDFYLLEYGTYFLMLIFCGRLFRKKEMTRRDKVLAAIIFIVFFCQQTMHMEFNVGQSLVLFAIFSAIYFTFLNFEFRELGNIPGKGLLMFVSRYSAELFVLQEILFIVSLWLLLITGKI